MVTPRHYQRCIKWVPMTLNCLYHGAKVSQTLQRRQMKFVAVGRDAIWVFCLKLFSERLCSTWVYDKSLILRRPLSWLHRRRFVSVAKAQRVALISFTLRSTAVIHRTSADRSRSIISPHDKMSCCLIKPVIPQGHQIKLRPSLPLKLRPMSDRAGPVDNRPKNNRLES